MWGCHGGARVSKTCRQGVQDPSSPHSSVFEGTDEIYIILEVYQVFLFINLLLI